MKGSFPLCFLIARTGLMPDSYIPHTSHSLRFSFFTKIEKIGEVAKEMIKNKGFYRMFRNKLVNFVADF